MHELKTTEFFETLQNHLSTKEINDNLSAFSTQVPLIATPEGVTLNSLEKHLSNPLNNTNKFQTGKPSAFNEYAKEYTDKQTVLLINDESIRAVAVFDFGTNELPGWKNNIAIYNPKRKPEYAALLRIDRNRMDQKELAEFIEDYAYCIDGVDSEGNQIATELLTQLIRNVEFIKVTQHEHGQGDYASTSSAMEQIDAKSKHGAMPKGFVLTCKPYDEFAPRSFSVHLSIAKNKEEVTLIPRLVSLDRHDQEMIEEARGLLADSGITRTFVGTAD